jgi:hypothetical protein
MYKIRLFLSILIIMFFMASACNNSNTGSNTTTPSDTATSVDTTLKSDTISVDPENFSDPH